MPIAAGSVLVALLARPSLLRRGTAWLDIGIMAALAAVSLQLVPLAPTARARVAPGSVAFEERIVVGSAEAQPAPAPISVDPGATAMALAVLGAMALAYWSTRSALRRGGLRFLARSLANLALVTIPVALLHHAGMLPLDAIWPPSRRDVRPWGPFMNRNDFAAWALLSLAVTLGYVMMRLQAQHGGDQAFDPERAFDERGTRVVVSACVATGGVMLSLSRSGLLGVAIAVTLFSLLGRTRLPRHRMRALGIALAALVVGAAVLSNFSALAGRVELAMSEGLGGRWSIWQQTRPIVHDFWPVGSGVGTYRRVMTLYQTTTRYITIAHADNEPLQILAEGGALLAVPAALVVLAFVVLAVRRLRADETPVFWLRAGAASGLAGVAAQNLVEMTLRVPAIGLLFVILAAIATHDRLRT